MVTLLPAGHFIKFTASLALNHFKDFQFASTIISHFNTPSFKAGDHFNTLSTIIQSSFSSTTAPIHSKSQFKVSSNSFVSSGVINSENLSQSEYIYHFIIQYSISFLVIFSEEE
jgi:hypothetical protein